MVCLLKGERSFARTSGLKPFQSELIYFPDEEPVHSEKDIEESEIVIDYYENRKHWMIDVFSEDTVKLRSTSVFVVKSFYAYRSEKLAKNAVVYLSNADPCHIETHVKLKFLSTQWEAVANSNFESPRIHTLIGQSSVICVMKPLFSLVNWGGIEMIAVDFWQVLRSIFEKASSFSLYFVGVPSFSDLSSR